MKDSYRYQKGRKKEYKIIHEERDKGRLAFRSAGSHSPIDVVSIDTKLKVIHLIQCKPDSMSDNAKQKLLDDNIELNNIFRVEFLVK